MRVAMFGYQTWGHRTLQALLGSGHDVALVVTHPKSEHAYEKIWDDSVAGLAAEHGVPVLLRARPDDELVTALKEAEPDIIVANNWRTWIPPEIFRLPRHGTLNVHDSLLPAYAGFSPLIWALINGEEEVGVTAHLMDEELDAGDILLQRAVPVGPSDTATDLFHRTVALIEPIVRDALTLIDTGRAVPVPPGPVQGELLPQTLAGGQPDRLDLAKPRTSSGWCAPSRTRIRTPSPSTGASAYGC
ncbi:methionyl-tRNA formyltransferase [Nonomuraea ferruginea]